MPETLGGLLIALLFALPGYVGHCANRQFKRTSSPTDAISETLLNSCVAHFIVLFGLGWADRIRTLYGTVGKIGAEPVGLLESVLAPTVRLQWAEYLGLVFLSAALWGALRLTERTVHLASWLFASSPTNPKPLWDQLFHANRLARRAAAVTVLLRLRDGRYVTGTVRAFELPEVGTPGSLALCQAAETGAGARWRPARGELLLVQSADIVEMEVDYVLTASEIRRRADLTLAWQTTWSQRSSLVELALWCCTVVLPVAWRAVLRRF